MSEKENNNNVFKFSLYQENVLLCEKAFDANQFNPFTRYSINIRDILPRSITRLQRILSKRNYDVIYDLGGDYQGFDLQSYNKHVINSFPIGLRDELRYNPQSITQQIDDKVIKGVECKIGFYINNYPIVERLFYVDGFNPQSRWSNELTDTVVDISDTIFDKIKNCDIVNMWDDYDLINRCGLTINQIRELSMQKREELLSKIK